MDSWGDTHINELVEKTNQNQLGKIMREIKVAAEQGKTCYITDFVISRAVADQLKSRKFVVETYTSGAAQISWCESNASYEMQQCVSDLVKVVSIPLILGAAIGLFFYSK